MLCLAFFPFPCLASTTPARESDAVLEQRAVSMLTDDQCFASFYRWRIALEGESALPSLRDQMSVSEYVAAIFAKVPA